MANKYDEFILRILRLSIGIDGDDTQHDKEFNEEWTKNDVFDSVMKYEATYNPTRVKEFVKYIYGVDLDSLQYGNC